MIQKEKPEIGGVKKTESDRGRLVDDRGIRIPKEAFIAPVQGWGEPEARASLCEEESVKATGTFISATPEPNQLGTTIH